MTEEIIYLFGANVTLNPTQLIMSYLETSLEKMLPKKAEYFVDWVYIYPVYSK